VTKGVNPAGFQVFSFRQPSKQELDHDFLWRSTVRLPERGRIGIFNRSYYEETLVVRVHPEYLDAQKLPHRPDLDTLWSERYSSIVDFERHLSRNGTVILKFWLNVSKDEQKRRFLSRLNDPQKYWKFSAGDLDERALWDDYMLAYEDMIDATSSCFAPWFAIPADDKLWMRVQVAKIIVNALKELGLAYPTADTASFEEYKAQLQSED
jgi:PPK2 family polyphosphate:nucleotide phosphotransferase